MSSAWHSMASVASHVQWCFFQELGTYLIALEFMWVCENFWQIPYLSQLCLVFPQDWGTKVATCSCYIDINNCIRSSIPSVASNHRFTAVFPAVLGTLLATGVGRISEWIGFNYAWPSGRGPLHQSLTNSDNILLYYADIGLLHSSYNMYPQLESLLPLMSY